jgi:hypothetical protein
MMVRPYMAAIESQLDALAVTTKLLLNDRSILHSGWTIDRYMLLKASPFAWSEETTRAVLASSKTIPLDTGMTAWNLQCPVAWWHFEKPLPFQTVTEHTSGVRALGFGWIKTEDASFGMPCHTWIDDPHKQWPTLPSQTWEWREGTTLGEMLDETRVNYQNLYGPGGRLDQANKIGIDRYMENTEGISRFVLAGLAWLKQKVLVTEASHVERHRRKAFTKATQRQLDAVQVIQLRKSEHHGERREGESEIEYSCRWAVAGHWRNQACGPKLGDHRLTYIMPYIKGPDDKPFREAPRKAYEVKR